VRDERDPLPEEIRERRRRAHELRMQGLSESPATNRGDFERALIEGAKIAADDTPPQRTDVA
jgi:hypothetical protein